MKGIKEEKYQIMFLNASEAGGDFELVFFRRLDDEFNKVIGFYRKKVQEVVVEAENLSKQMGVLIALRVKVENPMMGGADLVVNHAKNGVSSVDDDVPIQRKHEVSVSKGASSLKVVHKHGPCSQLIDPPPAADQILRQDQARVNAIHTRYTRLSAGGGGGDLKATDSTAIPAKDGSSVGTGNYVVTVGLGSPKKDLTLIFDTGSDLTWTQCRPCVGTCYKQKDPTFDPTQSSTYANVSCSSTLCSSLVSATGNSPRCSSTTCLYGIC